MKPVFVRKKDRLTVQEREREEAKQRQAEREAQILAEQRYIQFLLISNFLNISMLNSPIFKIVGTKHP